MDTETALRAKSRHITDAVTDYIVKSDPLDAAKNRLASLVARIAEIGQAIDRAEAAPPPLAARLNAELDAANDYATRAVSQLKMCNLTGARYSQEQAEERIQAANALLSEAGLWEAEYDNGGEI